MAIVSKFHLYNNLSMYLVKKLEQLNNKNANYANLNGYELFVNSALDIDVGD